MSKRKETFNRALAERNKAILEKHGLGGKRTKRVCRGGPWDGYEIAVREGQNTMVLTDKSGNYIGRYLVREIQQKTRTIRKVEWETPEQKQAHIRRRLQELGPI